MKVNGKIYSVELTEDEIRTIVTALQVVFADTRTAIKKAIEEDTDNKTIRNFSAELDKIRGVRNDFSKLIGITYMGDDV